MKQEDSLNNTLQSIAGLQQQQITLLNQMNSNQAQQLLLEQQQVNRDMHETPKNFQPPNVYGGVASNGFNQPTVGSFATSVAFGSVTNQFEQFKAQAKQLSPSSGHYGFFDSVVGGPDTKTSREAQTYLAMDYGDRASRAFVAGGGTLASAGIGLGASALMPGIGGIVTGIGAGALVGSMVDNGIKEMKKQSAYEKYFARESYRFISPQDSKNNRGLGGFSLSEGQDASTYLRNLSTDMYMKDSEMMKITQKFTEGGLLKDTKDLENFKEKMESLTKNVKTGALILNETYDSIAELMGEMKKAGIDNKNFNNIMGMGKMLGSLTGTDASDITRNLINMVKQMNSGTGASNENTLSRTNDTMIYMQNWYDTLKQNNSRTPKENEYFNLITNSGGVQGSAASVQMAMEQLTKQKEFNRVGFTFFDYDTEAKQFMFNRDRYNRFVNGNQTYEEIMDEFSQRAGYLSDSGHVEAIKEWENNADIYMKNSLNHGELSKVLNKTVTAYQRNLSQNNGVDFSFEQTLGQMGVNDSSTRNLLAGYLQFRDQKGNGYGNYMRLQAMWETSAAQTLSQTPGLDERWQKAKDSIGKTLASPFVDLGNMFKRSTVNLYEKINGIDYKVGNRPREDMFELRSDLKTFSSSELQMKMSESNKKIALAAENIAKLAEKGYTIDNKMVEAAKAMDTEKGKVRYERDKIVNWDDVVSSIKDKKDVLVDQADKNNLSESILAALLKYNEQGGGKNTNQKIAEIAEKMGNLVFEYGGNQELALAAYRGGDSVKQQIDAALGRMGYSMDELRAGGNQGVVASVTLDSLSLGEGLSKKVQEILSQTLTTGGGSAAETAIQGVKPNGSAAGVSGSEDFVGSVANTRENKNLIRTAADAHGISRLDLAALMATEKESNDPNAYKANSVETGIFGITQLGVKTVNSMINKGYRSLTTGEQVTSVDQVKGNAALQIDMTSTMFKERLEKAKGNAPLAYAFYNGSMVKVARDLANIGFTEDKYATATDEETLEAIGRARGTNHESYKATKRYIKMKNKEKTGATEEVVEEPIAEIDGDVITPKAAPKLQTTKLSVVMDKDGKTVDGTGAITMKDISKDTFFQGYQNVSALFRVANMSEAESKKHEKELLDKAVANAGGFFTKSMLKADYKWGYELDGGMADTSFFKNRFDTAMKEKGGKEYQEFLEYKKMREKQGYGLTAGAQKNILMEVGKQFGIEAGNFDNLGAYNSALVNSARAFYNENYKAMSSFSKGGELNADGKRWESMDVNDKAVIMKMMEMIEKLDVVKPGLKGDGVKAVSKDDYSGALTDDDRVKLKHLTKEKDAKGNETGRVIFNPFEESKNQASIDDLIKYQEGGAKNVDYIGSVKKSLESKGITVSESSLSGLKGALSAQLETLQNESLAFIGEFGKEAQKLIKEKTAGLSEGQKKQLENIMNDPTSDNSAKQLQEMRSSVTKKIAKGESSGEDVSKLKETQATIDRMIELGVKIKATDTQDFMTMLEELGKISERAKDLGKLGELFSGQVLDEDSGKSFYEDVKKSITEGMSEAGIKTAQDVLTALQQGGEFNGKQLSAEELEMMMNVVSEGIEKGLNNSLNSEKGREKVRSYASSIEGGDEVVSKVDRLSELLKPIEKIEDATEKQNALNKVKKETDDLRAQIVEELSKATKDTADENSKLAGQVDNLKTNTADLASVVADYDKSIQSAISTLKKRIDNGWGAGEKAPKSYSPLSIISRLINPTD